MSTRVRTRTRFPAPSDATAPAPAEERGLARDEVRMLVARPNDVVHAMFRDLPDHLDPGDLVVFNDSATVNAAADAVLIGRGPVVVHVATTLDGGAHVLELRTAPDATRAVLDAHEGDRVMVGNVALRLVAPYPHETSSPTGTGNRLWLTHAAGDLRRHLRRRGRPIAYGYLDRTYPLSAYQSVFSTRPGSAEMPSAGRPFTRSIVTRLVTGGIRMAPITLHTGVSSQEDGEGPQPEWFDVPAATAALVNSTLSEGGRVVAVGTTVTRALESAARRGAAVPASGWTERLVTPDDPPQVVRGLITGWHDPHASHLLLVEAVAGTDLTQAAYDAAVRAHYLWHEFGDSALLLP
ncbi:MAG TPA: S-adenosylmethionine:tRNA ribosyltransferase-isomerase [Aeromicrobium sp.]|nr:S-adenosylmethionine:tRNA ribosyltransferase-isomerase [Aeromicrobium sp.]